jgi:hypothetical protein
MKKYFIVILLFATIISAQKNDYIEFFSDKGRLTITDDQKAEFGRYDGFQLYLNNGENLYFMAYSEELPVIVAVADSTGKVIAEDFGNEDGLVSINTKIKKSGSYFLYILNRTNSLGNYYFQYAIASNSMLKYTGKNELCGYIEFLLKHTNAYFVFLQNPKKQLGESNLILDSYLDEETVTVNLRLFETDNKNDAEKKKSEYFQLMKKCGLGDWKENKSKIIENSDYNELKTTLTENVKSAQRKVELTLFDYSKASDNTSKKYVIELSFSKTF